MIPFSPPRIDQNVIDEVIDTLLSGWITTGKKTRLFEQNITNYCGNKKTLCVSSATAGLELMLRWYGVGEGDEVILPAFTYCATANVVLHCGATPVMVDINEYDFNISVDRIKEAITEKTKVIIPVDMGGYPCDYDDIYALVTAPEIKAKFNPSNEIQETLKRILILSDAAHSMGAVYRNRKTGCCADITVFSFHAVKNITTAEGGAIALQLPYPFDNEEIYNYLCILASNGQSKDALAKTQLGGWKYDVVEAGYKMNMPDILACIGLVELARYDDDTLVKRKTIFDYYNSELSKYNWAIVPQHFNAEKSSSYHLYQLRIKGIDEVTRDLLIQHINQQGVSVNVHFQPLPLLTLYKRLGYKMEDYPVAYQNYACEISLPIFYDITPMQMKIVIDTLVMTMKDFIQGSLIQSTDKKDSIRPMVVSEEY
jgi:dTDP-4-amino-4,6-dideoxygalactose transaminase